MPRLRLHALFYLIIPVPGILISEILSSHLLWCYNSPTISPFVGSIVSHLLIATEVSFESTNEGVPSRNFRLVEAHMRFLSVAVCFARAFPMVVPTDWLTILHFWRRNSLANTVVEQSPVLVV